MLAPSSGCLSLIIGRSALSDAISERPRKRQRTAPGVEPSAPHYLSIADHLHPNTTIMRDTESDQGPAVSASNSSPEAGPSSLGNGHSNGNGFVPAGKLNGAAALNGHGGGAKNGTHAHTRGVVRVDLPGTALYTDEAYVSREEFVRVVLQSLRDVGYMCVACSLSLFTSLRSNYLTCRESAATLEAESGYTMEAPIVSQFRRYVLEASWPRAEDALIQLGLTEADGLWVRVHCNALSSLLVHAF